MQLIQNLPVKGGGRDAELRNKLPEKLPFEIIASENNEVLFQHIWLGLTRPDKSSSKTKKLGNVDQVRAERFEFKEKDDKLTITFVTENQQMKKAGILNLNSWCQIKTNRRFSMESTWGYYKLVFNIFYGQLEKADSVMNDRKAEFIQDYQSLLR